MEVGNKRGHMRSSQDLCHCKGHGGELNGWKPSQGSEWFESYIGHCQLPPWSLTPGERQVPLAGWRAGGTNRMAVGSLDSALEERVHTCLLTPEAWQREWICSPELCSRRVCVLSHLWLFATQWAAGRQAPQSMEFSRPEYWSGLPFPSPV